MRAIGATDIPVLRAEGHQKLKWMERANQVCLIAIVILFTLTIVFSGLSMADKIHPASGLISFSCILVPMTIFIINSLRRRSVAIKHHIDFENEKIKDHTPKAKAKDDDSSSKASNSDDEG